ncbi:MAG: hypothetical protein ACRDRN_00810 [Sciscionella sp.]
MVDEAVDITEKPSLFSEHWSPKVGNADRPEMLFSTTEGIVAMAAGAGGLDPSDVVPLPMLAGTGIRWEHLLQQASMWHGELWGKPTESTRRATATATRRSAAHRVGLGLQRRAGQPAVPGPLPPVR